MIKIGSKQRVADILHRSIVSGLIGLTLIGVGLCSLRVYNYFANVRPNHKRLLHLQEQKTNQSIKEAINTERL